MSTPAQPVSVEGLGVLLARSFKLLRAQIGTYVVISLVFLVPGFLLSLSLMAVTAAGENLTEPAALLGLGTAFVVLLLIIALGSVLMLGALIHAAKTQIGGGKVSPSEAYRAALSRWPSLAATTVIIYIVVGLGLALLVLPGLVAFFFLCLAPIALMVDDMGVRQALSRSCSLALKVPVEIVVISVIASVVASVLGAIPVIGLLVNCVVMPWDVIAMTLAYGKAKKTAASA
ncbi:MAG TPA: hypothetical protein DHW14_09480 [Clostridiales bacterium]|nr:hypothetical protein [Clostridiales bacterium]